MAYFGNAVYPLPLINPGDIVTITTSTALSEASYGKTFILTAAGALTIILAPLLMASKTRKVTLLNDSVAGVTTVNTSGSDTIRLSGVGVSSLTLAPGDVAILENNGTAWSLVDNSSQKASLSYVNTALAGKAGLDTAESFTKAQRGSVVALPATTGTVAIDFNAANNFAAQVTGALTFGNGYTNAVAGQSGVIRVQQNGATLFNWAFGSNWKYVGGSAAIPAQTQTLSAFDEIVYYIASATEISFAVRSNVS